MHSHGGSSSEPCFFEICDFTVRHFSALLNLFVSATNHFDMRSGMMHNVFVSVPRLKSLALLPSFAEGIVSALPPLLKSRSKCRWLCVAHVLDAIVLSRLRHEPSPAVRSSALQYCTSLAFRLQQEGSFEAVNPEGEAFLHCTPLRYSRATKTIAFTHRIFRSFFVSIRLVLEIADDAVCAAFTEGETQLWLPQQQKVREEALMRSEAQMKATIARTFSVNLAESAAQRAVGKFKKNIKRLSGGEWLCNRLLTTMHDEYLMDLLSDRVRGNTALQALLWKQVEGRGVGLGKLAANAATLLAHCGLSFAGRDLRRVPLSQCSMPHGVFCACDMRGASLRGAILDDAVLSFAEAGYADFRGVELGACEGVCGSSGASVLCVACSPEGCDTFASGDEAGRVTLWDLSTAEFIRRCSHGSAVCSIHYDPTGNFLLTSSVLTTPDMKIWAVSTLELHAVLKGLGHRVTHGRFCSTTTVIASSYDWTVRLWSVREVARATKPAESPVCATSAAPFGASPKLHRGVKLAPLTPPPRCRPQRDVPVVLPFGTVTQHSSPVTAMSLCHQKEWVASLSADGLVIVASYDTLAQLCTFRPPETHGANSICFSTDGVRLAVPWMKGVSLFSPVDGTALRFLPYPSGSDVSSAVVFSPDGSLLVAAEDEAVVVWDVASAAPLAKLIQHKRRVSDADFSRTGDAFVTASWDGSVRVWPTSTIWRDSTEDDGAFKAPPHASIATFALEMKA